MATLETLLSQQMTERLGWTLIHLVWQAAAVALLLAFVLRGLRRSSSNVRYVVSCLALVLIVALPLVTMRLVEVSGPVAEAGPVLEGPSMMGATPVEVIEAAELPVEPFDAPVLKMPDEAVRLSWTQRLATTLEPVLPWLVSGWLLGVFGLSAWHLGGWAQLQRMKRRMVRDVAEPLRAALADLSSSLGVRRTVGLLESALVEVPTVVGWVKPAILLPASALSGLSTEQLEAILAHELAHVRRCDYLVNLVQTVVEILGFYHPAVWWVSRRIREERENCCDDLAVQVCGDSRRYARALTCLEELRHHGTELAMAASGGSLIARIARLLGRPVVDDRRFTWLPGLIALLVVAVILIPTALVLAAPDVPRAADRVDSTPNEPVQARETRVIEATTQAQAGQQQDQTRILVRFRLFTKAMPDKVVDRETRLLIGEILAAEIPQAPSEMASTEDATLIEILRTCVVGRLLISETVELLVDVLQSRGYLEGEATPEVLANNDQQAQMNIITERLSLPSADPASSPKAIELGTFIQVTPHLSSPTSDRIRLEIGVEWKDRAGEAQAEGTPPLRSTEIASTVTTLRNRYVTLLAEPDNKGDAETASGEFHLVMLRADLFEPESPQASAAASLAGTQAQPDWSAPQEGVRIRLRADRHLWRVDEIPILHWDACNVGQRQHLHVGDGQRMAQLEVDGVWYRWPRFLRGARLAELDAGRALADQRVTISPMWSQVKPEDLQWRQNGWVVDDPAEAGTSPHLSVGRHTIRLAVLVEPSRSYGGEGFRVVSLPVEITVVSRTPGQARSWLGDPELARAVRETLFTTTLIIQESPRPRQPEMPGWIAQALTRARELVLRAEDTPVYTSAVQMADALTRLQRARDSDPTLTARHFADVSRTYSQLLNVVSGEPAFSEPPTVPAASARLLGDTWREHVNTDPMVRELAKKIAEIEIELAEAQQTFLPEHPEIARKKQLLEALHRRLEERCAELARDLGHDASVAVPKTDSSDEQRDAVVVEARFVLVDRGCMEALRRGLPIEGVTAPADVNALHEIGIVIAEGRTPLLERERVELLLGAIRQYDGSTMLSAPRVTVLDGEPASISLCNLLEYIRGYREPNDASQEPVAQRESKDIGVKFDVTPSLVADTDSIRVAFEMEISSLLEMQKAVYRDGYEYDIPTIETVRIDSQIVVPNGLTVLIGAGYVRSLGGPQPTEDQPPRPLLILLTPKKITTSPPEPLPPLPVD